MNVPDSFGVEQQQQQQQPVVTRAKPVQRFLKRGEGTQRRIFGPQLLRAKQQAGGVQIVGQSKAPAQSQAPYAASRVDELGYTDAAPQVQPTLENLEELAELQAETTLVELEVAQRQGADSAPFRQHQFAAQGAGIHAPTLPHWSSPQTHLQEDYELEEFKALEQQIKKDVCGGLEPPKLFQAPDPRPVKAPQKQQQQQPAPPRPASYTSSHWGDEDAEEEEKEADQHQEEGLQQEKLQHLSTAARGALGAGIGAGYPGPGRQVDLMQGTAVPGSSACAASVPGRDLFPVAGGGVNSGSGVFLGGGPHGGWNAHSMTDMLPLPFPFQSQTPASLNMSIAKPGSPTGNLQRHPKPAGVPSGPATSTTSSSSSATGGFPASVAAGFRGYSRSYASSHAAAAAAATGGGRGVAVVGVGASGGGRGGLGQRGDVTASKGGRGAGRVSSAGTPTAALLQQQFGVATPPDVGFEDDQEQWEEGEAEVGMDSAGGQGRLMAGYGGTWSNAEVARAHGHMQGAAMEEEEDGGSLTQPFVRSLFQKQQPRPGGASRGGAPATAAGVPAAAPGRRASGNTAAGAVYGVGYGEGGGGGSGAIPVEIERLQQQLLQETAKVQQEKSTLVRMRTDLEKAANKLEAERQAMERKQVEAASAFDTWRQAEVARLQRDRRVLEKQSKAILKLPSKKERGTSELLEAERKEASARDARHRLTVERLRRQVVELQDKCRELREEVRWHEAARLQDPAAWHASGQAAANGNVGISVNGTAGVSGGASARGGTSAANSGASGLSSRASASTASARPSAGMQGLGRPGSATSSSRGGGGAAAGASGGSCGVRRAGGLVPGPGLAAATSASAARLGAYHAEGFGSDGEELELQQRQQRRRPQTQEGVGRGAIAAGGFAGGASSTMASRSRQGSQGSSSVSLGGFAAQDDEEVEDSSSGMHPQAWNPHSLHDDEVGYPQGPDVRHGIDQDPHPSHSVHLGESHQQRASHVPGFGGGGVRQPRAKCDLGARMNEGAASSTGTPQQQQQRSSISTPHAPNAWDVLFGSDGEEEVAEGGCAQASAPRGVSDGKSISSAGAGSTAAMRSSAGRTPAAPKSVSHTSAASVAAPSAAAAATAAAATPTSRGDGGMPAYSPVTGAGRVMDEEQQGGMERGSGGGAAAVVGGTAVGGVQGDRSVGAAAAAAAARASGLMGAGAGEAKGRQEEEVEGLDDISRTLQQLRREKEMVGGGAGSSASSWGAAEQAAALGHGHNGLVQGVVGSRAEYSMPPVGGSSSSSSSNLPPHPAGTAATAAHAPAAVLQPPFQPPPWPSLAPPAPTSPRSIGLPAPTLSSTLAQHSFPSPTSAPFAVPQQSPLVAPLATLPTMPSSLPPFAAPLAASAPFAAPAATSVPIAAPFSPPIWPQPTPLLHAHAYGETALAAQQQQQQQQALTAAALAYPQQQQQALAAAAALTQQPPLHHQHARWEQQQQPQPVQAPQPGGGDGDAVVREVHHADGKLERFYTSGKRLVAFNNGTRKLVLPPPPGAEAFGKAATTTLIAFVNGDYKHQLPGGTTEYYYAEVGTWHLTQPDGVEVFYFPSGQAEAHHPSGLKEILFPDGAARHATADGVEHDVLPHQLSLAVKQPPPQPRWQGS